ITAVAATAAFVATAAATFVATATTTAVAATAAAEAAWLGFLRLRGIHAECAALEVVSIKRLDGSVQLALVAEGHECKSFGSAGFAVGDDFDPFDGAICGKE